MTTDDGTAGARTTAPAVASVCVVRGDPDPHELAALVAVLAAGAGAGAGEPNGGPVDQPASWAAYWRGLRPQLRPGTDGWRESGRPR